jgi:hypothetical protein
MSEPGLFQKNWTVFGEFGSRCLPGKPKVPSWKADLWDETFRCQKGIYYYEESTGKDMDTGVGMVVGFEIVNQ